MTLGGRGTGKSRAQRISLPASEFGASVLVVFHSPEKGEVVTTENGDAAQTVPVLSMSHPHSVGRADCAKPASTGG